MLALFLRYEGIFYYFRAFKTQILHIYSLTGQILKQLFPSVSVPSEKYIPLFIVIFNGKVEVAGNYNLIGFIRDSHTLIENDKKIFKETGRYGIRIPDLLVAVTKKYLIEQ